MLEERKYSPLEANNKEKTPPPGSNYMRYVVEEKILIGDWIGSQGVEIEDHKLLEKNQREERREQMSSDLSKIESTSIWDGD